MKLYSAFNFFMQCLQKALCVLFAGVALAGFAYFATYIVVDLLEMLNQ